MSAPTPTGLHARSRNSSLHDGSAGGLSRDSEFALRREPLRACPGLGTWSSPLSWVGRLFAHVLPVLGGDRRRHRRSRDLAPTRDQKSGWALVRTTEDRMAQGSTNRFGKKGRSRVADLSDLSISAPGHSPALRKALEAEQFLDGERSVGPMERPSCGSGPSRNGPGRAVLGELQQKRPVAAAAAKDGRPSTLFRQVEVVPSLGDGAKELPPVASQLWPLDCGDVGKRIIGPNMSTRVGGRWPCARAPIPASNEDCTISSLRDAIVRGIEHARLQAITRSVTLVHSPERRFDGPDRGCLPARKPGHVLDQNHAGEESLCNAEER